MTCDRTKPLKLGALLLISIALSGCYGRIELNQLAITQMLGIDLTDDGRLMVSAQFVIPGRLGGQAGGAAGVGGAPGPPVYVIEATGTTLSEALSFLQAKLPRRLFTSQIQVVVLGEKFARAGVNPLLESITRERELRLETQMVVTRGRASDLLRASSKIAQLPAAALVGLIEQDVVPIRTVREFMVALAGDGIDPFLPLIGSAKRIEMNEQTAPPHDGREFEVTGIGVFQDSRLVGFVPRDISRGLAWIINEMTGTLIATVTWPRDEGSAESPPESPAERRIRHDTPSSPGAGPGFGLRSPNQISAQILRATTHVKPQLKGDQLRITVNVHGEDDLVNNQAGVDLTIPENISKIESLLSQGVEKRMEEMLHWAQDVLQADIFGFGGAIHRRYPKAWRSLKRDWHASYAKIPVDITVSIKVRRIGQTKIPASYKPGQIRK